MDERDEKRKALIEELRDGRDEFGSLEQTTTEKASRPIPKHRREEKKKQREKEEVLKGIRKKGWKDQWKDKA